MPMRIVLRALQAVFIITALVLIIPTVTYITKGENGGGTTSEQCTTKTDSSGTATQTCEVPIPGNEVEVGIAYALMSISAALGAVALRPDGGMAARLGGTRQPVAAAPPFPPQGPQAPQGPQNRGW